MQRVSVCGFRQSWIVLAPCFRSLHHPHPALTIEQPLNGCNVGHSQQAHTHLVLIDDQVGSTHGSGSCHCMGRLFVPK